MAGAPVSGELVQLAMLDSLNIFSLPPQDFCSSSEMVSRPPLPIPVPYDCFSPLVDYDLTQVDLTHFPTITARIDRVDLLAFPRDLSQPRRGELREALGERVTFSNNMPSMDVCKFVVNDPTPADLAFLVEHFYMRQIIRFELAIDFKLHRGENDLRHLWLLKAQLRHCLAPQGFARLSQASRKAAKALSNSNVAGRFKFASDGLGEAPPVTEVIWENPQHSADVLGLYVKTHDRGASIKGQPFVRLELRLRDLGPHAVGLGRLGMLPSFAPTMRTKVAKAFFVGSGFSVEGKEAHAKQWGMWGAQWASKNGAQVSPNMEVNRRVGLALNDLRKSLLKHAQPSSLDGAYADWIRELA